MHRLNQDWEYNVLGIYKYHRPGQFSGYYQFLRENHHIVEGDVAEVGVYRGSSLLATALLLRELGSTKTVWGFDSFSGFPSYDERDQLGEFDRLLAEGSISQEHYDCAQKNIELKRLASSANVDVSNISSSGDFSDAPLATLERKIEYLGLDNVRLIKGDFAQTMAEGGEQGPKKLCATLIDCDLYAGYKVSLPYTWSRLSRGGYVHLDEYYSLKFPGARRATDEFFLDKPDQPQRHQGVPGDFERWFVRRVFT